MRAHPVCSVDSSQDAQKPSIRATSNEALCILLWFWCVLEAISIAHLVDDFFPCPFKCVAIVGLDAVRLGGRLYFRETGKERAEQLELALGFGLGGIHRLGFDLRQHLVDVVEMLAEIEAKRSEEHTSELQSPYELVCRLLLEKKKYIDVMLPPS